MNVIQSLIDRQLGIYSRFSYDSTLRRLVVDSEESFYGLQSSNVVASFDQDPPIFACRFSEAPGYEHILALANEDGRVAIQNTESKASASLLDGIQCHDNAVFDLAWMPGHMSFVTVSGDHTACLWDVGEGPPRKVMMFCSHTRSVKTAAFRPNEPHVFASGGRDGAVLVWDTRGPGPAGRVGPAGLQLRPEACLAACHAARPAGPKRPRPEPPRAASVTGLVFQDDLTLVSCGECDGNIKVWDLRRTYSAHKREPLPKHAIPYCGSSTRNGYTNLLVDAARVRLYASCMDNVIYCFNIATYNTLPERRYVGHENGTFYIKTSLSPDSMYLVSGSSDKNAYVWNVRSSEPVARLTGHWAEVTCAAWCQRGDPKVVTCSDDARHKLWRVGPEPLGGAEWRDRAEWRGRAESVPRSEGAPRPRWGTLDKTPSSLKRKLATPSDGSDKRCRPSGPSTERRTKRCLTDMMNAARGDHQPAKRLRLDEPDQDPVEAERPRAVTPDSPIKRPASPDPSPSKHVVTPNPSPSKRARHDSPSPDWGYVPVAGSSFMTPTKNYESRTCKIISPTLKDNPTSVGRREWPTGDLPDFVLTGEAPHQRLMSPVKQKQDTTDWLTLMVRERRSKGTKLPDCDKLVLAPLSPRDNLPARRNSVTDKTPKAKKTRTLLKYFSVATKGK